MNTDSIAKKGVRYDMMPDLDCEDSALLRDCKDAIKYVAAVKGYRFNGRFEIRELNVYNIHSMELTTYPFMLSIKWSELNDYDKRVCRYVYHYVHGIRFDAKNGLPSKQRQKHNC